MGTGWQGPAPLHPLGAGVGEGGPTLRAAVKESVRYLLPDEVHSLPSMHELVGGEDAVQERAGLQAVGSTGQLHSQGPATSRLPSLAPLVCMWASPRVPPNMCQGLCCLSRKGWGWGQHRVGVGVLTV